MAPATPIITPEAAHASQIHPNLLKNGTFNQKFDQPPGQATLLDTTDPIVSPTGFGFGLSAAPHWDADNNHASPTTTALVLSTRKHEPVGTPAGTMLQVCTTAIDSGIRQSFGALNTGPAKTMSAAWVYVLFGRVGLGTGNVGATGDHDDETKSTDIGTWKLLKAANGVSPANMFIVFAIDKGGACFFIDDAWVYAT
jgi:hypothetical protein